MNPSSDCPPSAEALWPQCLEMARARRAGRPQAGAATWAAPDGWALPGTWTACERELFDLVKPVLDPAPGGPPWVIGQLGQSLDGCVATHTGDSFFVSGPESLLHLHRLRALCDAVVVGAGTVAADNPRLTTRHVEGDHPTRVVLDPGLRLGTDARVFTDDAAPTLVVCAEALQAAAQARHGAARVIGLPTTRGGEHAAFEPWDVVQALHRRGLQVVFVEGGGVTVSRFLAAGCLDRLHLAVSPVLIGSGRPGLRLPPQAGAMGDCQRPAGRVFRFGVDVLWDLDLRRAACHGAEPPAPGCRQTGLPGVDGA